MKVQTPKAENEQHLNNVRNLPCLLCGDWTSTEAAHLRMADARYGKPITGMQIKPRGPNGEECYVWPACKRHHARQHEVGEAKFWSAWHWIDPVAKTLALWTNRHHPEIMEEICKNNPIPHEAGDEIAKNR